MSSRNENGDYVQPWWLDGNDEDLQKNAYVEGLPADADDDGIVSTSSSRAVVETTKRRYGQSTGQQQSREERYKIKAVVEDGAYNELGKRPASSSSFQPKSARREKTKRDNDSAKASRKKLNNKSNESPKEVTGKSRTSREVKSTTNGSTDSSGEGVSSQDYGSRPPNSSPARETLKAWTDTGKATFRNAVDKIKSAKVASPKKSESSATRWNCKACTFLNVRDASDCATMSLTCEICGTPRETETPLATQGILPGATVYQDEIPCDPANVIERTFTDDRDNRATSEIGTGKRKSSTVAISFQSAFERLFYQKRQNSTTTTETYPAGSSEDFERIPNQQGLDNRSDTASSSLGSGRVYSVAELVASLGAVDGDIELPPALERRVRDFKFAQAKRRERHGDQRPWGVYGLYAHLSDIRADLEWAEDAAWRRQRGQPYLSWRDFDKSRDKGLHNRPWFTYGLLALCTIMMFVTLGVNGWKFEPLKVNPLIGPSSETLIKCGARDTNLIVNEAQWYRLFTPMILHAGLVHYVVNMLALYFIGGAVEQSHGFASAAVLFIIPAVGGNILSAICLPQYVSVGASGGIFGLIGGCIADISLNWNLLFLKTTTDANARLRHFYVLLWLGSDVVVTCLLGFTPFVDNFTHLGGFMYGFCCGISTIERLAVGFFGINADKCSRLGSTFMRFFGLIISIIFIMVTTVVLVQSDGVTSPCHGCRYISCVPFPPNAQEKWWYCDDCDVVTADLFRSSDGSGLYEQINIYCPNGEVEEILIAGDGIDDKEVLRRALPSYCRAHCEEVFSSN